MSTRSQYVSLLSPAEIDRVRTGVRGSRVTDMSTEPIISAKRDIAFHVPRYATDYVEGSSCKHFRRFGFPSKS